MSPASSKGEAQKHFSHTMAPPPQAKNSAQQIKQIDELQTTVQFLEKKRQEDRDKLKRVPELEEKVSHFENVINKLQSKCQVLHQENGELKRQSKDIAESLERLERLEAMQAEHESILELANLDREMAEEKAESFQAELDAIRSKLEELELENEILRDENEELGRDVSPEEKTSQAWIQLQRENTRLRDALLRLRDLSQEQEQQLKEDVKNLEDDSRELAELRETFDSTKARLLESQADNEDLREQLDVALGAETMIEQLTEKNHVQGEQLEDLRKTIEDLQDLKELNDELELHHVEHEKQLQEIIDVRDSVISQLQIRAANQDDELADREYTISKYRDLVSGLQTDIDDLRSSKQISDMEAENLENSSRAIMDLNRQLQASATTVTVKAIDMELRELDADQARDQLSIVQLYVPDAFKAEKDSILAYLRFKRINFKAKLLHGFIKQRANASYSRGGVNINAACDVIDKLMWVSVTSDRFVSCIETCAADQLFRYEGTLVELEPVERALNGYVESLKNDDLKEDLVADGLNRYVDISTEHAPNMSRSIAVMRHLSELYLDVESELFAEVSTCRVQLTVSSLENCATVLSATRTIALQSQPGDDGEDYTLFDRNSDATVASLRSAKVIAGKLLHVLRDMKARNLALGIETLPHFDKSNELSSQLFELLRSVGNAVDKTTEDDEQESNLGFLEVYNAIRQSTESTLGPGKTDLFYESQKMTRNLYDVLNELNGLASDLTQLVEYEKPSPPWVVRSRELQDRKVISAVAEEEIKTLKRENQERATKIKLQNEKIEEAKMKNELLERRNKDANKKLDHIVELEGKMNQAHEREKNLENALESTRQAIQKLEEERDRWMQRASEVKADSNANDGGQKERLVGSASEMDALKSSNEALQSANQYLRQQSQRSTAVRDTVENSWLLTPLGRQPPSSADEEGLRAVLGNIAALPFAARPLRLADVARKPSAQAFRQTPRYRLIDEEARWLKAWSPVGERWSAGPKVVGVDVIASPIP